MPSQSVRITHVIEIKIPQFFFSSNQNLAALREVKFEWYTAINVIKN